MSNSNGTAANTSTVEIFSLHSHSKNINSSIVEGKKLYLVATQELS